MENPFAPIEEIMRRHGATASPEEFHAAVNVCFHKFESEVYDQLHQDMWQSLPRQVNLLATDSLQQPMPEQIRALDIGSGTGLSTELLLRSPLGSRIQEIDLLDTSPEMLERAAARRAGLGKSGRKIHGVVEDAAAAGHRYDLIITCSVLHHVPDLASFLGAIAELQKDLPQAVFLHLQDPNQDAQSDPEYQRRVAEFNHAKIPDSVARFHPARIWGRIKRELKGEQGQDYLSKTNQELIRQEMVQEPLTVEEIFIITDIHVQGEGISVKRLQAWLPDYDLVSERSYGFFGVLESDLPEKLKAEENRLSAEGALNGEHVSACWRRRQP